MYKCTVQTTEWLEAKGTVKQSFIFEKTVKAAHYLLCLTLASGINEVATNKLASKGMAIVRMVE